MNYEYSEEEVAKKLGVARDIVRRLRAGGELNTEHYGVDKRQIRYSEAGVARISQILAVSNCQEANKIMGSIFQAKPEALAPQKAVVKTVFLNNHRFLDAMMGEAEVVIRLRTNVNFLPGMEFGPAGLIHTGGNLWDYVGRLPRSRGRW